MLVQPSTEPLITVNQKPVINPFIPGKKVPLKFFDVFDSEDKGYYFWEDQPVFNQEQADRLWEKYRDKMQ